MAHNPIVDSTGMQDRIGLGQPIPRDKQGVLFKRNAFERTLGPGETVGLGARLFGGARLYIIDCKDQRLSWRVRMPAEHRGDHFPCLIEIGYRVADGRYMIEHNVRDTETLIMQTFEPLLRRETRDYGLHDYREVEYRIEELLDAARFGSIGLDRLSVDARVEFEPAVLADIEHLERALKAPQQVTHRVSLPSKEPAYRFDGQIIFQYRILDPNRLPTRTVAESEAWLWQRVETLARRSARQHTINEVNEVEDTMQGWLAEESYEDHGMQIVAGSLMVRIELDEHALSRARELDEVRAAGRVAEERQRIEGQLSEVRIERLERLLASPQGALAKAVDEGQLDAAWVVQKMLEQREGAREETWQKLARLIDANKLDEEELEDLASELKRQFIDQSAAGGLAGGGPAQLGSGSKEQLPRSGDGPAPEPDAPDDAGEDPDDG